MTFAQPEPRVSDEPHLRPGRSAASPAATSPRRCGSLRIDAERELALCADAAGERQTVEIALVQPVDGGDELLVHAGTAIATWAGSA